MNRRHITFMIFAAAFIAPANAQKADAPKTGAKASSGQVADGEAGYKMGCSTAAARGSQACAELWSDKQKKEIEERKRKRKQEEEARRKNEGR